MWDERQRGSNAELGETMQDYARGQGVKGLLLMVHEEVPHGFGLRTRHHHDTADGGGDCGRPAQLSRDYWEQSGV